MKRVNKRHLAACLCIMIVFVSALCMFNQKEAGTTYAHISAEKSIANILIHRGDTIWSIAEEYYTELDGDFDEYIGEICRLNGISDTNIQAGTYIIIPYYNQET